MNKSVTKEKPFKKTNTRGRKKTIKPSNTLDKWILQGKNSDSSNTTNVDSVNEKVTKCSENKGKVKKLTNSKSLQRHPSGSFLKYGVLLPTFEEVLAHKQELAKLKKAIDEFDVSDDSIERFVLETEAEEPKPIQILDCKHLSCEELSRQLELNYQYLFDIVNGISKSERHKKFMTAQYKTGTRTDDLTYNTSMITFTFEQKQLLLRYLSKHFGDDSQYFFKVLLPELCTKIFMDTHNMTYSEAVSYLDSRPPQPIEYM